MILAEFDDWLCPDNESGFKVELAVVPREGDHIRIHRDLVSKRFLEDEEIDFNDLNDGCAEFLVLAVTHELTSAGHTLSIDIDPYWRG